MKTASLLVLSFSLLVACKSVKTAEGSTASPTERILFLAYEVEKKDSINASFRLIQQLLVEGRFKEQETQSASGAQFLFRFIDADGRMVKETRVADPTVKQFEGVDDQGKLIRRELISGKADVTFRIMFHPSIKAVQVYQNNTKGKLLFQHNLTTNS